jgi:dTDP-glucose pyrophosphorylase
MLKIVIPLAGSSESFIKAGYLYPKPLIDINGKLMIELVIEGASIIKQPCHFIFIINNEDSTKYHLDNTLKMLEPNCDVIRLKRPTKGGLCSTLMAIDKIDDDDQLLILNGDQVISENFNTINQFWLDSSADAGIVTFKSVHPRWSYARVEEGQVIQTAEKNPISNSAIAGYYYFSKAKDFFDCAFQSIKNDVQLEGNFYISPVMNEYVLKGKLVKNYQIENNQYHSFYSPQMVEDYRSKQNG